MLQKYVHILSFVLTINPHTSITKGYNRSLLVNTLNQRIQFIPNDFFDIIIKDNFIKEEIDASFWFFIDQLLEKGMILEKPDNLKLDKNLIFDTPESVIDLIIDVDNSTDLNHRISLKAEIEEIGTSYVQLRCFTEINFSKLENIFQFIESLDIIGFELILPYSEFDFENLIVKYQKLYSILIHGAPQNFVIHKFDNLKRIEFQKNKISSKNDCGYVSQENFNLTNEFYKISANYNSCLYKKLAIDTNGDIKNCASCRSNVGNISKTNLVDAVRELKKNHSKLGEIKKEQVKVCSDCEYRNICTDCRVFIDNTSDLFSRPKKCEYNPYLSLWDGEEGYRTLNDCGVGYNSDDEFIIDHEKIKTIFNSIYE